MAYIGSSPTKVVSRQSANIFTYTATANQTAFTGTDANGNTLACTPSDIMVHMNGLRLEESDFTATTTTVTLGSGAAAGDEVTITAFVTFETADAYTKSTSDARYVNTTGDTMSGGLTVNSSDNVNISRGASHGNNYEGGRLTLKNGSGITKQYGLDTYYENFRIFREDSDGSNGVVRLEIDSNGRVTTPNQPTFSTRGTSYTQINNWATVKPTTTDLNVGSHYNSSTGVWTVPVAGNYLVAANGLAYPSGTGGSGVVFTTSWYKNGTIWEGVQEGEYYSNHTSFINTAIIPCAANDTLEFKFYRGGGTVYAYGSQFIMYGYLLG
jgi:hypothetical protein